MTKEIRAYDGHLVVNLTPPVMEFEPAEHPISQEESHRRIETIRKEWAPYAPKEKVNA